MDIPLNLYNFSSTYMNIPEYSCRRKADLSFFVELIDLTSRRAQKGITGQHMVETIFENVVGN